MYERILAPLDGSELAEGALPPPKRARQLLKGWWLAYSTTLHFVSAAPLGFDSTYA